MGNKWVFYVVLITVIFSFRRNKGEIPEDLGRECTAELKGLAILMVLLGHMAHIFGLIDMPVTSYLGAQAVDVFLFLSGFGLTASYYRSGLKNFWKKRILTLYVPYTITNILKLAVLFALYGWGIFSVGDIVLNFLGLSITIDTSMWYIQYILISYLLFFVIFLSEKIGKGWRVVMVFAAFFLVGTGLNLYQQSVGMDTYIPFMECYSHYLGFPLGVLGYFLYEKREKAPVYIYPLLAAVSLVAFIGCSVRIPVYGFYLAANLTFTLFAVNLFICLKRLRLQSVMLQKLGGLAFHMYLNELIIMMLLAMQPLEETLRIVLIFGLSIGTAWMTRGMERYFRKHYE